MVRRWIALALVAACGACSTTDFVAAPDGRYRTVRTTDVVEYGGIKLPPQTFRNTIRTAGHDVYIGEIGGTSFPHMGAPQKNFGLCIDEAKPNWLAIYTPTLQTCIEVPGATAPPVTLEPLNG